MAGTEEVLGPGAKVGMLDRVTFGEGRAHEILRGSMDADLRGHAADKRNLIGDLGGFFQVVGHLKIRLGGEGVSGTVPFLRVKGIDVAHAAFDIDEDDSLGAAETVLAGRGRF